MPTTWRSRALLAIGLLVAVVGVGFAVKAMTAPAAPAAAPTPTASEAAGPAQPKPFKVRLIATGNQPIDNQLLFGRRPDVRKPVARRAARAATEALQRYLNAAFVAPDTRSTAAPLHALLTKTAQSSLDAPARRALGDGGAKIKGGDTRGARARATVVYRKGRPIAVTVRYTARMRLITQDQPAPVVQRGAMVFVRVKNGWRADMVDVTLSGPGTGRDGGDGGAKSKKSEKKGSG